MTSDRLLRVVTCVLVLALGALGFSKGLLVGGAAWLALLFFAMSGMGWLVVRIARVEDPDFGLRAAWGVAGYIVVGGPLVAAGVCSRPVLSILVAIGIAAFAWRELVTPAPIWQLVRGGARWVRANPLLGYLVIALGIAALIRILGAVGELDRNAWDDDVAYIALVKRLVDVGNQIEPFSFRRLGAYGGQILLQGLGAARGSIANVHVIDQGLCFGLALLLILGYVRELRRVGPIWVVLAIIALLVSPDISINTASYWSGVVVFFAMYRTIVRIDDVRGFAIAGMLGAATCTLRQSYMPAVALFLLLLLVFRLQAEARETTWSAAWRNQRRLWLITIGVSGIALLPWCIAAYLSSRTFLFPFMQGTWNHGLSLAPSGWSWVDKLSFLINCLLDAQPFVVLPIVFPLIALVTDTRRTKPLFALFVAGTLSFLLLVASFTGSDAYSLSRYAFGYIFALLFAFVLELGAEAAEDTNVLQLAPLGRWVLLAALIIQVAFPRAGVVKRYKDAFQNIRQAMVDKHGDPSARVEARHYAEMQAAIPRGGHVAVLLDDPAFLDFARNEIFNLDTPGYASPGSQLPMFTGADAVRSYFLDEGIRYVAFVRSDHSRYMFRRDFWLWRIFHDAELFQVMSAYIIDTLETFDDLSKSSKVVFDRYGLMVLDLDGPHTPAARLDPKRESERRDAWMAQLAKREGLEHEWELTSKSDLIYLDGLSGVTFDDIDADPKWYDVYWRDPEPKRGVPVRWMHRRSHLRLRGDTDMHLVIRGRVNLGSIYTRPRLDVSLDGELLTSVETATDGTFTIDVTVPRAKLGEWRDFYVVFNTIGTPERDVKDLRIARLDHVTWQPR